MMILCWVVVSIYILIANSVDGDCSMAFDEYYMGMRKCCDDYQCGGQIKLCQNCSEPRSEQNNCHNGSSCLAYSEKNPVILTSKNKTSVIHDDTIADCCWRVYSGRGYNGKSRLISGRLNIPGPRETKCEDVG